MNHSLNFLNQNIYIHAYIAEMIDRLTEENEEEEEEAVEEEERKKKE